jgi:tight adherence protein C
MLPLPLLVWCLALVALALAFRERRAETAVSRTPVGGTPAVVRLAMRCPCPAVLRERALSMAVRRDHVVAGIGPSVDLQAFARARAGLAIGSAVMCAPAALTGPAGIALAGASGVMGWAMPVAWLRRRARTRRTQIVRALPDLIDLVVICTRAGMALEPALRLGIERVAGPLGDEIRATLVALDLGTPRREALRDLADRVGCVELTGLVGALLQAEELGTPIALVLARQAELVRAARIQLLREHAAKAAPKVQLVVAMVMVPSALLVVMGVLVIRLVGELGGSFQ